MDRPPQAKTKVCCKTSSEKNEVTLGAQGEKKGNRRCSVCHLYSTHNSVTCPTLEKNKDRLEAKRNKKRGRPAGAKNKKKSLIMEMIGTCRRKGRWKGGGCWKTVLT